LYNVVERNNVDRFYEQINIRIDIRDPRLAAAKEYWHHCLNNMKSYKAAGIFAAAMEALKREQEKKLNVDKDYS
jgi:hypothetical protein